MKVAGYCRVSTDKEDQANSFQAQQSYFREYIRHHPGWELHEIYADEGITGTSTRKRIQFNRMIADAHAGKFQLIITKEISRFSRNILDTISYTRKLKSIGVGVLFMTENLNTLNPESEMLLSFMGTMAQEESRRTSVRVKWGQSRQMERGVVFGRSMLGYDVKDGRITVNPEGAEIVKLIFHKYSIEKKGVSRIARELREAGYRTYTGNPNWSASHILKILKNEKYVGDLVQQKSFTPDYLTHHKKTNQGEVPLIRIENHHEPIISRPLWALTQETLKRKNVHNGMDFGHSNRYVFSGRIKCGECGASFVARKKTNRDGTVIRRWSCYTAVREGNLVCDVGRLLRDDDAANMLAIAIRCLRIDRGDIISHVTALALEAIQAGEKGGMDDSERLRYELERIKKKREDMMDSYFSDEITKADMQALKARYEKKLEDLQARLEEAEKLKHEKRDAQQIKDEIQGELTALLQGETQSEILYQNLLDHITVFKDRRIELRLKHLPQVFRFV